MSCCCCECPPLETLPCPTVVSVRPNPAAVGQTFFTAAGFDILLLNPCPNGCAMIPLVNRVTLRQNGVFQTVPASVGSTTVFTFSLDSNGPAFVAGPATLEIFPTNPTCPVIVLAITFADSE